MMQSVGYGGVLVLSEGVGELLRHPTEMKAIRIIPHLEGIE